MAVFVHMTSEDNLPKIRRNGIRAERLRHDTWKAGIFAMPVTPDFFVTHQWVRELRRFKSGRIAGVYFRIDDNEMVSIGHYMNAPVTVTAAEAVSVLSANPQFGFQVIVPRKILPSEISNTKVMPQLVGWRYYPAAKGRVPCGCPSCQRGEYGGRKLRDAYEAS
jgi:hypothetical protein